MRETYALVSPAPAGSGERYFFLGYLNPKYSHMVNKQDCISINLDWANISTSYQDKISPLRRDIVEIRRITPYIPRLRNHIFLIDVASYEEGKDVYRKMIDMDIALEDDGWSTFVGGLDSVEDIVLNRLDADESPEEIYKDLFDGYRGISYVMRCAVKFF